MLPSLTDRPHPQYFTQIDFNQPLTWWSLFKKGPECLFHGFRNLDGRLWGRLLALWHHWNFGSDASAGQLPEVHWRKLLRWKLIQSFGRKTGQKNTPRLPRILLNRPLSILRVVAVTWSHDTREKATTWKEIYQIDDRIVSSKRLEFARNWVDHRYFGEF